MKPPLRSDSGQIDVHVGVVVALVAIDGIECHVGDRCSDACKFGTVDKRLDVAVVVETITHRSIRAGSFSHGAVIAEGGLLSFAHVGEEIEAVAEEAAVGSTYLLHPDRVVGLGVEA